MSVLAELGVAPWPVPPGPDAAETALLTHANHVYRQGGRTFVVASADRRFAELAHLGRLEVLAWAQQPVAKRLTEAAHALRRLPYPETVTDETPLDDQPADPASASRALAVDGAPEAPSAGQDPSQPRGQGWPAGLAHAVVGGLGAGIGLAVGQAIGQQLLSRRAGPPHREAHRCR